MAGYDYASGTPAIRSASREHPWRCPWCGEDTWFVSDGDDARDQGRVEMYCNNSWCDSRETVVLVTRGHDEQSRVIAGDRADVRALERIDDGATVGFEPLTEFNLTDSDDMREVEERDARRLSFRQTTKPYTIQVP